MQSIQQKRALRVFSPKTCVPWSIFLQSRPWVPNIWLFPVSMFRICSWVSGCVEWQSCGFAIRRIKPVSTYEKSADSDVESWNPICRKKDSALNPNWFPCPKQKKKFGAVSGVILAHFLYMCFPAGRVSLLKELKMCGLHHVCSDFSSVVGHLWRKKIPIIDACWVLKYWFCGAFSKLCVLSPIR